MRLLAAGLLLSALLVLPSALAVTDSLSLSGASAVVDLTATPTQYIPITVGLRLDPGFFCQNDGTAKVTLALNVTGPINASLNATTVTFTIPADVNANVDPGNPSPPPNHATTAYQAQKTVNLTVSRSDAGNGTAGVVATFDGTVDGCQANPDPTNPTATAGFDKATKSLNVSTQSLVGNVNRTTTPTPSTPTNVTTTTPSSSTPVSTSPTATTVGDNPTPTPDTGKKGLPGPEVALVIAGAVALAVVLRRRK